MLVVPDVMYSDPLLALVALPEPMYRDPLPPLPPVPELSRISPLAPEAPESGVVSCRLPLAALDAPLPPDTIISPPVEPLDRPADNDMSPPAPDEVPTENIIDPPVLEDVPVVK